MYEYGIIKTPSDGELVDLHRGPMSKQDAEDWIREAVDDGIPADMFSIVRRQVGSWFEISELDDCRCGCHKISGRFDHIRKLCCKNAGELYD